MRRLFFVFLVITAAAACHPNRPMAGPELRCPDIQKQDQMQGPPGDREFKRPLYL